MFNYAQCCIILHSLLFVIRNFRPRSFPLEPRLFTQRVRFRGRGNRGLKKAHSHGDKSVAFDELARSFINDFLMFQTRAGKLQVGLPTRPKCDGKQEEDEKYCRS